MTDRRWRLHSVVRRTNTATHAFEAQQLHKLQLRVVLVPSHGQTDTRVQTLGQIAAGAQEFCASTVVALVLQKPGVKPLGYPTCDLPQQHNHWLELNIFGGKHTQQRGYSCSQWLVRLEPSFTRLLQQ